MKQNLLLQTGNKKCNLPHWYNPWNKNNEFEENKRNEIDEFAEKRYNKIEEFGKGKKSICFKEKYTANY